MNRRKFIQNTSFAMLPVLLNGFAVKAFSKNSIFPDVTADNENILVIIQLFGGNDGLNTIIPLHTYSNYFNARKNIAIPENKVLKLERTDEGMHPTFAGCRDIFNEGKLAVIQSVGYPSPDLSHFKSTDIWMSGSDSDRSEQTGWMARYLSEKYKNYPKGYPDANFPDPPAIQIGSASSLVFRGSVSPFAVNIADPDRIFDLAVGFKDPAGLNPAGDQLKFIREMAEQTNVYSKVVKRAAEKASAQISYPDNSLAAQLKIVAKLISGGLKTKVYMVSYDGFDTHAQQTDASDTTQGRHADLLKVTGDAIKAFQKDLEFLGIDKKVTGMTFSEFGRRIASNDSMGTDHGTAAPLFVFGSNVKGGMYGDKIIIPDKVSGEDNLTMQTDFRSVYATVLKDHLGASGEELTTVLHKNYPLLNFFK